MTRDHLLGFPAVLRQHDEPVVPKEQTVKERPAAFVAFETGDWAPKMSAELFEAETHEVTLDGVRNAYRRVSSKCGRAAGNSLRREFGVYVCAQLKPEQWAEFIATAERRLAGWVKWSGGKQPVADVVVVEVRYGEGTEDCGLALEWDWRHHGDAAGDIVEYRVIK